MNSSNPTPDHNLTRDNQQQPPQWAVEAAKEVRISVMEDVEDCSDGWSGQDRFNAAIIAKHAHSLFSNREYIPKPEAEPSGDGQRTPRTATENDNFNLANMLSKAEAERDALRARVAQLEAQAKASADRFREESWIVDRVWNALGISTYEQAKGKTVNELVADLRAQLKEATERAEKAEKRADEKCAIAAECLETAASITKDRNQLQQRADALRRECDALKDEMPSLAALQAGTLDAGKRFRDDLNKTMALAMQQKADLTTARDELAKWRTAAEKLAEALREISVQQLPQELSVDEAAEADFVGAYEMCVATARRALAAGQGEGAGM